jgi:ElaB/YqjD/DUF883 family membrane-anchored ribosome-binding protein
MAARRTLRDEIAALKHEVEALAPSERGEQGASVMSEAVAELEHQIGDLTRLVENMLDEAEETVARHPVATVAGALALGIVIGRLTAR